MGRAGERAKKVGRAKGGDTGWGGERGEGEWGASNSLTPEPENFQ